MATFDDESRATMNRWGSVLALGADGFAVVPDEAIDALGEYQDSGALARDRRRLTNLVGRLIDNVAQVEQQMNPVITYLLDPQNQAGQVPSVARVKAGNRLAMLKKPLPPDWPDGETLVQEIGPLLRLRNVAAHSSIYTYQLDESGFRVGAWFHHLSESTQKLAYRPTSRIELRDACRKAEVVAIALAGLAGLLAMSGRPLRTEDEVGPTTMMLANVDERGAWFGRLLRELFPAPRYSAFVAYIAATEGEPAPSDDVPI